MQSKTKQSSEAAQPSKLQKVPFIIGCLGVALGAGAAGYTMHATSKLEQRVMTEVSVMQRIIESQSAPEVSPTAFKNQVEVALKSIVEDRRLANEQASADRIQRAQEKSGSVADTPITMNSEGQVVFGNPDADVTISTFEDFRCGYCTQYHPVLQEYVKSANGQVNWVYKPFPILGPESVRLANAAECVAQEEGPAAFWEYSNLAYKTKDVEFSVKNAGLEDAQNVLDCTDERRYSERITESMSEGRELNVTGTPASIFRNNASGKGFFVSGFLQQHQVDEMVQEALNGQ